MVKGVTSGPDLEFERPLAELVSFLLERPVTVYATGVQAPLRWEGNWFCFRSKGQEFGVRLDWLPRPPKIDYFLRSMELSGRLAVWNQKLRQELALIGALQVGAETEQYFEVCETGPEQKVLGRLAFAGAAAGLQAFEELLCSNSDWRMARYRFPVELSLFLKEPVVDLPGERREVSDSQLVLTAPWGSCPSWGTTFRRRNCGTTVLEVGECMKNEEQDLVQVKLILGTLELPLKALLAMRPGMRIEFQGPEVLTGLIQVGTTDWAKVKLILAEDKSALEICEIKNWSAVEETFAKK